MAEFKEIAAYLDQLHRDIGQLMAFVEKCMGDAGYVSLSSSGNRASWRITSHFGRPDGWRAPYLTRCYVVDGEDENFSESLIFLIVLETDTIFDFPTVICARMSHPPLTEKVIYSQVFLLDYLKTLVTSHPTWQNIRQEEGWIVAEPTFRTAITTIRAYILNLFSLSDQQRVMDNIIRPLTEEGILAEMITRPTYAINEE